MGKKIVKGNCTYGICGKGIKKCLGKAKDNLSKNI
jgi:hypothetical protein